jgi:acetyl esterase/lipase
MLDYLRLKIWASLVRLIFWWKRPAMHAKPDEIIRLPSRDLGRTIKANFYHSKTNKPSPVLINFHGSGFTVPWHGTDDEFARQVVQTTEYAVLDVAYRLAPENPFPAAIHDVKDVVKWVIANVQDFDTSRVSISGFSAGANLALVASTQLFPLGTFRHVICFYPPTDLAKDHYTKVAPDANGNPLPPWMLTVFTECYASGLDWRDPRISPLNAAGDSFQQNTLVITCAYDNLCAEGEALVQKIRDAQGSEAVVHRRMEDCDHAWDKSYQPGSPQEKAKDEAYDLAMKLLRR